MYSEGAPTNMICLYTNLENLSDMRWEKTACETVENWGHSSCHSVKFYIFLVKSKITKFGKIFNDPATLVFMNKSMTLSRMVPVSTRTDAYRKSYRGSKVQKFHIWLSGKNRKHKYWVMKLCLYVLLNTLILTSQKRKNIINI